MNYYEPLQLDKFYHIYNRGINSEDIFKEEKNYKYFLQKYAYYLDPIVNTYAYCLLKNHFHLLIQPDSSKIESFLNKSNKPKRSPQVVISRQFASFFSSYAQSINKVYKRTGGLFEEPFECKLVDSEAYFNQMIIYIHQNPQKHGFVTDFRDYPHSSYHSYLTNKATKLKKTEVIALFKGIQEYENTHQLSLDEKKLKEYLIEF